MAAIGIIGGMGPEATNELCRLITHLTPASGDRDHIPVICYNNSGIPSRLEALTAGGQSPIPELVRTALTLQNAGASFLIMPCNVAHSFIGDLRKEVQVPIVSMIECCAEHLAQKGSYTRVGILASTPTITLGLYQDKLGPLGIEVLAPSAQEQELVMSAIYGPQSVKAGHLQYPREVFTQVGRALSWRGAQCVIAACTEVSVALSGAEAPFPVVDSLEIIARESIRRAKELCQTY